MQPDIAPADGSLVSLLDAMVSGEKASIEARLRGEGADDPGGSVFWPDESRWPGIVRLASLVADRSGRAWGLSSLPEWVFPRLQRLGLVPEILSVVEAVAAIEGAPELQSLICHRCCRRLLDESDAGRAACSDCRRNLADAYQLTMGPLVVAAKMVERGSVAAGEFLGKVDPEIRYWAWKRFGHPGFGMETWDHLVCWLAFEHASEGEPNRMTLSRVVELLRAEREARRSSAGESGEDGLLGASPGPDTPSAISTKPPNSTAAKTEEMVAAYIKGKRGDDITVARIVEATGLPRSSISKTSAWRDYHGERVRKKGLRSPSVRARNCGEAIEAARSTEPDPAEEVARRELDRAARLQELTDQQTKDAASYRVS